MAHRPSADQLRGQRLRVAAVVTKDDHVLLAAHQFSGGPRAWLLPGGGVDLGETVIEAAIREVREETGIEIEVGGPSPLPRRYATGSRARALSKTPIRYS